MNINNTSPINFESKKINMTQAREVCNLVQQQCPYPSYWKQGRIDFYKIIKETPDVNLRNKKLSALAWEMKLVGGRLDGLREFYLKYANEPFKYFTKLVQGVKKFQTLNCGEAARLTYMACRVNDIAEEDAKVVDLEWIEKGKVIEMDHAIAKIKGIKGLYGIDALLNETSSLGNLAKIYKSKYVDEFQIPKGIQIQFTEKEIPKLSDEEAQELGKMFPEFLIK